MTKKFRFYGIKKSYFVALFLGIIFVISSCIDEIDFPDSETADFSLVIQGQIIKGTPNYASVSIRSIFSFDQFSKLLDAKAVWVEDEVGNRLELTSKATGQYFREIPANHPSFKINYDKSYKIIVEIDEERTYTSTLVSILPSPTPGPLWFKAIEESTSDNFGNIRTSNLLSFSTSPNLRAIGRDENARLRWQLTGTYKLTDSPQIYNRSNCSQILSDNEPKACYITFTPFNTQVLLDGSNLSSNNVDTFNLLKTSINAIFAEGFYLTARQFALEQEAFDYFAQIRSISNRSGDPFEAPVGEIITNISNISRPDEQVFGYFYGAEEAIRRVYVDPSAALAPRATCPATVVQGMAPAFCCNCSSMENSTTIKPSWWVF